MGFGQKLQAFLGLDTSEYDSKLKGAKSSMASFGTVIAKIGAILAGAFSIHAIVNFTKEAMKLAAEAEGVKNAFEKIGSPQLLEGLKKATRGVMAESDLMQLAVKAKNFNIPLQDMAKYLEFATNRAIITGKSISELTELIVTGLGRESSRSFIELGLSAKDVQAAFQSNLGIMPLITTELDKMGTVVDSASVRYGKLTAEINNLKESYGEWANQSKVVSGGVRVLTDMFTMLGDKTLTWIQKLGAFNGILRSNYIETKKNAEAELEVLTVTTKNIETKIEYVKTIGDLKAELADGEKAIDDFAESEASELRIQLEANEALREKIRILTTLKPIKPLTGNLTMPSFGGKATPGPGLATPYPDTPKLAKGLKETQDALIGLSERFAGFFSDVNLGFQGMIDGVITGIKRLVAYLIAKAVILGILSIIFPGSGIFTLANIIGGNVGKLLNFGVQVGKGVGNLIPATNGPIGMGTQELTFRIRGKDLVTSYNRHIQDIS